jgi:hypothetical protein
MGDNMGLRLLALCFCLSILSISTLSVADVEWKESSYHVAGAYHPDLKIIEWRESTYPLAGVYNPKFQKVEWRQSVQNIAGAYNAELGVVEWRESSFRISGVYNPALKNVEWRESTAHIAGVYSPESRKTEWRESSYFIAGCYNSQSKEVEWRESRSHIAAAYNPDTRTIWIRLTSYLNYSDGTKTCSWGGLGIDIHLLLHLKEGVLTHAAFYRYPGEEWTKLNLTQEEYAKIAVYSDSYGKLWIDHFSLNSRLASRIIYRTAASWTACMSLGPHSLKTLGPLPFDFRFDTKGLGEEIVVSGSQKIPFHGILNDGRPYKGELQIYQRH